MDAPECAVCGDDFCVGVDGLCPECRTRHMTPTEIPITLLNYERLCSHASKIAEAYVKATAKDSGNIERYSLKFEFPDAEVDLESAVYYAEWTETWAYGGYEDHCKSVPFRFLLMPQDQALAEIQTLAEEKLQKEADAKQAQKDAAEARRKEQYKELQQEFGGVS